MEKAPPPVKPYVSWKEVQVSGDKGRRVVHYYLKDALGHSDLAVVGRERSLRHMSYDVSSSFLNRKSSSSMASSFSSGLVYRRHQPLRLRSRREVVDWLSSLVSDSSLYWTSAMENRSLMDDDCVPMDSYSLAKGLSSQKMRHHSRGFTWLGSAWTCRKRRKHYQSFCRNATTISVHDFVYVMGEDNKRLIAYVEDLYEDMNSGNMVSVRWFHKVDEVGIALPPDTDDKEIFFTLCLQDLSVECIDGLTYVFSIEHFERYLADAANIARESYLCCRKIDNDEIKPFDITQVPGYWDQDLLRYICTPSARSNSKLTSYNSYFDATGYTLPRKARRKIISTENAIDTRRNKVRRLTVTNGHVRDHRVSCLPGEDAFKQRLQQEIIMFPADCQVEVLCEDSGMRGCWFRCVVLKRHRDKVKVQYRDVQDADGTGHLEEWLLAAKVAKSDKLGVRLSGRSIFRPHPPSMGKVTSFFHIGSVVDAWWHDGWWEGIVMHRVSEHEIHVFFPADCRTAVFDQGELRHSKDWVDGKWNEIKERPDLVSFLSSSQESGKDIVSSYKRLCMLTSSSNINQGCQSADAPILSETKYPSGSPDSREICAEENKSEELTESPFENLRWAVKRRRRVTSRKSIKDPPKKEQVAGSTGGDDRTKDKDPSICFRFSLTKSFADQENCKVGGDVPFNPRMSMSNLVMTR